MYAFGICRFDAGAEGIHLAWNPPDVVCLSSPGFDIQRRIAGREAKFQCVSLTAREFLSLSAHNEIQSALGPVLYRRTGPLPPVIPSAAATPWPSSSATVDVYTLELATPTDLVRIAVSIPPSAAIQPFAAFIVAVSAGKAVAFAIALGDGTSVTLNANLIDTVVVYTVSPLTITICAAVPEDPNDSTWTGVPFIVKGLTLPIRQADPSLLNETAEWNAAKLRMIVGDALAQTDFDRLVAPLRLALANPALGRPGERILLGRLATTDPFEEMSVADQLALLQIHPELRRALGFGYFDRQSSGLVPGQTYQYRITGHFNAQDLSGAIYDFHTIPSQTVLPATIFLADIRLSFPRPVSMVLEPAPSASALNEVSRRGIQVLTDSVLPGWLGPSLDDWSIIIDLPVAASSVTLEMNQSQSFVYAGGFPWAFPTTSIAVPSGTTVKLTFPAPVSQIRLRGKGILFAIRVPAPALTETIPDIATTAPIIFAAQPLPAVPLSLTVTNLQAPPGATFSTNQGFNLDPHRPLPGFQLEWLPAATANPPVWPPDGSAPPIDSIGFQIEHSEVTLPTTNGPWEPILPGDNLSLGTRDNSRPSSQLGFAANLADVFPLRRARAAGAGYAIRLSDVFDLDDTSGTFQRPVPAFGTYHQYRIRAIDTVGRVSSDWTLSNIVRFEKHIPPPLPAGPQPEPALGTGPDGSAQLTGPPGVKARALVANDPALTAADRAVLGTHGNAIVLDWGWRDNERQIDALTREFRVYYLRNTPDTIPGTVTSVTAASGGWDLAFTTNRVLNDGDCIGQWITTGGYPFRIASLTGGANVVIHVEAALANPLATPVVGPARFGRPLSVDHQRPVSWDARASVVPLTSADTYRYAFYDLLNLSPTHPKDSIWVGVSAADGETYVDDEVPGSSMNGGRPGNESSIVACSVGARDFTQPVFSIPPPLGDLPELVTEEPTGRQLLVSLNLPALIPGALPPDEPIALDRCSLDTILGITTLNSVNQVQLRLKDGTQHIVAFPNPGDESAVIAALESPHPERIAARFLMYLATQHPRPTEIFERTSAETATFTEIQDRIPPKPARFFYRVRRADVLGRVSDGGAILPVVVRVPSTAPPVAPERVKVASTPTSVSITLRIAPDPDIASLLVFSTMRPFSSPISDLSGAELLRVPNRRDLYPLNGLRLRIPGSGALVAPVVKSLTDPDVIADPDGNLSATVSVPGTFGNNVILWTYALSRDGIPSRVAGPFTWGVPKA
jgi:hypothetical protein